MPTSPQRQQQRGRRRPRSRYAQQLHEKQTLKGIYGVRERQLRIYYVAARQSSEETGPSLISLLERRLDNAVFRAGIAETRAQARQMVSHGMFEVNSRPVDVPSIQVREGDIVKIKEGKRKKGLFENFEKRMQGAQLPDWIRLDVSGYGFNVTGTPSTEEAAVGVDIRSVVELFAR